MLVNCSNCNKEFNKIPSEIKRTKNHFCSRHCSTTYNNKKYPKRQPEGQCITCKTVIPSKLKYCKSCCPKNYVDWSTITIGELKGRYPYQKANRIRSLARAQAKSLFPEQKCAKCGYDNHVHVCHIKAIKDFPPETPISTVNAKENLILLCPNHHWEFDNGLLNMEGAAGVEPTSSNYPEPT